jgi:hypothetical protein
MCKLLSQPAGVKRPRADLTQLCLGGSLHSRITEINGAGLMHLCCYLLCWHHGGGWDSQAC